MIRLCGRRYYLEDVSKEFFWNELDRVTSGQSVSLQFGRTRPLHMQSGNIFVGRKVGDRFSLFLRGGANQAFRAPILCKGTVSAEGRGITIDCSYEYPFWNLVVLLLVIPGLFLAANRFTSVNPGLAGVAGIVFYGSFVGYNLFRIRRALERELELIERKAGKARLS